MCFLHLAAQLGDEALGLFLESTLVSVNECTPWTMVAASTARTQGLEQAWSDGLRMTLSTRILVAGEDHAGDAVEDHQREAERKAACGAAE